MKLFVVHVNIGCCSNNSDGKIWVTAANVETAKSIVKKHSNYPILQIEEFNLENEIIFSSCEINLDYQLKYKIDNW